MSCRCRGWYKGALHRRLMVKPRHLGSSRRPSHPSTPHKTHHDQTVRLRGIEPVWLREGLRFWLRCALTYHLLTWSSVVSRARNIGSRLGRFARDHGYLARPADQHRPRRFAGSVSRFPRVPAITASRNTIRAADPLHDGQPAKRNPIVLHVHARPRRRSRDRHRAATLTHTALRSPIHTPRPPESALDKAVAPSPDNSDRTAIDRRPAPQHQTTGRPFICGLQ